MVLDNLFNPMFTPLLGYGYFWAILIISFVLTLLITLAYKYLTDQKEMKRLKAELKKYQKKIRDVQKKDPKKALDIQKKAMELNMKYMKHSFKPTLYTFIPIILVFGWMNSHLAYEPITTNQEFLVSVEMQAGLPGTLTLTSIPELDIDVPERDAAELVSWRVKGNAGEYKLLVKYGDIEYAHDVLISDAYKYKSPEKSFDGAVKKIKVGIKQVKPLGNISLLGWKPGWLGTYILFSIIISILLRRVMKIS